MNENENPLWADFFVEKISVSTDRNKKNSQSAVFLSFH